MADNTTMDINNTDDEIIRKAKSSLIGTTGYDPDAHTLLDYANIQKNTVENASTLSTPIDLTGTSFNGSQKDIELMNKYGGAEALDQKGIIAQHEADEKAKKQSTGEKVFNNIARGVFDAGTAYVNGTLGLAAGMGQVLINSLDPNKHGSEITRGLWDNSISRLTSAADEWVANKLPVYKTQEELDHPISSMFSANGASEFLGMLIGLAGYGGAARTMAKEFSSMPNLVGGAISSAISAQAFAGGDALNSANNWEKLQTQQFTDETNARLQELSDEFDNTTDDRRRMEIANEAAEIRATIPDNLQKIKSNSTGVGDIAYGLEMGIMSVGSLAGLGKSLVRGFSTDQTALKAIGKPVGASSDMHELLTHDMSRGIPNNKFIGKIEKDAAGNNVFYLSNMEGTPWYEAPVVDEEAAKLVKVNEDVYNDFQIRAARDPKLAEKAATTRYSALGDDKQKYINAAKSRAEELQSEVNYLDAAGKKDYVRAGSGAEKDAYTTELEKKISELDKEHARLTPGDTDAQKKIEEELAQEKANLAKTTVTNTKGGEINLVGKTDELEKLQQQEKELQDKLNEIQKTKTEKVSAIRESGIKPLQQDVDTYKQTLQISYKQELEEAKEAINSNKELQELKNKKEQLSKLKEGDKIIEDPEVEGSKEFASKTENEVQSEIDKKKNDIQSKIYKVTKEKNDAHKLYQANHNDSFSKVKFDEKTNELEDLEKQLAPITGVEKRFEIFKKNKKARMGLLDDQIAEIEKKEASLRDPLEQKVKDVQAKLDDLESKNPTLTASSEEEQELQNKIQKLRAQKQKLADTIKESDTEIGKTTNAQTLNQEEQARLNSLQKDFDDMKKITDRNARAERVDALKTKYEDELSHHTQKQLKGYYKIAKNEDGTFKFNEDGTLALETAKPISDVDYYKQMHENLPKENPFAIDMADRWKQAQVEYSRFGTSERKISIDENLNAATKRTKFGKVMTVLRNPISQTIMMPSLSLAQTYAGAVMESDLELWRSNYKNQKNIDDLDDKFSQFWSSQFSNGDVDKSLAGINDYYDEQEEKAQEDFKETQDALKQKFMDSYNNDLQAIYDNENERGKRIRSDKFDLAVRDLKQYYIDNYAFNPETKDFQYAISPDGQIENSSYAIIERKQKEIEKNRKLAIKKFNTYNSQRQKAMSKIRTGNIYFNDNVSKQMSNEMSNPELLKSALTGAIMGFGITPHIRFGKTAEGESRFYFDTAFKKGKQYQEEMDKDNEVAKMINNYTQQPGFQAQIKAMARHAAYDKAMDYAARSGDEFSYESAYDSSMAALVEGFARAGQLDRLKNYVKLQVGDINDSSFTEEDFKAFKDLTKRNQDEKPKDSNGTPFYSEYDNATFDEIKDKVLGYKKAMLSTINDYEKSRRMIELSTAGKLDAESEAELTWLDVKNKQWRHREENEAEIIRGHIQMLRDKTTERLTKLSQQIADVQLRKKVLESEKPDHVNTDVLEKEQNRLEGERDKLQAEKNAQDKIISDAKKVVEHNKIKKLLDKIGVKNFFDEDVSNTNNIIEASKTNPNIKLTTKEAENLDKLTEILYKVNNARIQGDVLAGEIAKRGNSLNEYKGNIEEGKAANVKRVAIENDIDKFHLQKLQDEAKSLQDFINSYNELIDSRGSKIVDILSNPENITKIGKKYEENFPADNTDDGSITAKEANKSLRKFAQYDSVRKDYMEKKREILSKFVSNGENIKAASIKDEIPEDVKDRAKKLESYNDYSSFAKELDAITDDNTLEQIQTLISINGNEKAINNFRQYADRRALQDMINTKIDTLEEPDEDKAMLKQYVNDLLYANDLNHISNTSSDFMKAFEKAHKDDDNAVAMTPRAIKLITSTIQENMAKRPSRLTDSEIQNISEDAADVIKDAELSEQTYETMADSYNEDHANDASTVHMTPEIMKSVVSGMTNEAGRMAINVIKTEGLKIEDPDSSNPDPDVTIDTLDTQKQSEAIDRVVERINEEIEKRLDKEKINDEKTRQTISELASQAATKAAKNAISIRIEDLDKVNDPKRKDIESHNANELESHKVTEEGGQYHFLQSAIPEFELPTQWTKDWIPSVRTEDLGDYLSDIGNPNPNAYVDEGHVHDGDEVLFMIDPAFEAKKTGKNKEKTIFTCVKDSSGAIHIIGCLHENDKIKGKDGKTPVSRYDGLMDLRKKIIDDYTEQAKENGVRKDGQWVDDRYYSTMTTKAHIIDGVLRHTEHPRVIKEEDVSRENTTLAVVFRGEDISKNSIVGEDQPLTDGIYIATKSPDKLDNVSHFAYVEGRKVSDLKAEDRLDDVDFQLPTNSEGYLYAPTFKESKNLYLAVKKAFYFRPGDFDIRTYGLHSNGEPAGYRVIYLDHKTGKMEHIDLENGSQDVDQMKKIIFDALDACDAKMKIDSKRIKSEDAHEYLKELARKGLIVSDIVDDRIVDRRVIMDYYDKDSDKFADANYGDRSIKIREINKKAAEEIRQQGKAKTVELDGHTFTLSNNGWVNDEGNIITPIESKETMQRLSAIVRNPNPDGMFYDEFTGKVLDGKKGTFLGMKEQGDYMASHPKEFPDFVFGDDAKDAMESYSDANSASPNHVKTRANETEDKKNYTIVVNGKEEKADRLHTVIEEQSSESKFSGNDHTSFGSNIDDACRNYFSNGKLEAPAVKPDYVTDQAWEKIFSQKGPIAQLEQRMKNNGETFYTSSIVMSHAKNSGFVAGEIDILVKTKSGAIKIYDIKTIGKKEGSKETVTAKLSHKYNGSNRSVLDNYTLQISGYKYMADHDNTGMYNGKKVFISGIELVPFYTTWKDGKVTDVNLEENIPIQYNDEIESMINGSDVSLGRPVYAEEAPAERTIPDDIPAELTEFANNAIFDSMTQKVNFPQVNVKPSEISTRSVEPPKAPFRLRKIFKLRDLAEQEEFGWLKEALPQVSHISWEDFEKQFQNVAVLGPKQWGAFVNNVIVLANDAAYGTTYHEAFHAVFRTMMDKDERKDILNEARETYAKKGMTNLEVEEELAEDFRKFQENQMAKKKLEQIKNSDKNCVVKFFESLKVWMHTCRKHGNKVNKLFSDISDGKYASKTMKIEDEDRKDAKNLSQETIDMMTKKGITEDDIRHIDNHVLDDLTTCSK